jgi:LysM repeat protein
MLKPFRIIVVVIISTASSLEAVAQGERYKAVILNGKPSRLNIKTGIITTTDGKVLSPHDVSKTADSIAQTSTIFTSVPLKDLSIDRALKQRDTTYRIKAEPIDVAEPLNNIKITESKGAIFHTVEEGETLYALSEKYQTSLGALQKANHLQTTLITVGQTLKVTQLDVIENDSKSIWIVVKGDTLYGIAKKNSTTVKRLKRLNQLQDNTIRVGQELQIR